MEVRNCKRCGKLYNYVAGMPPICPACKEEAEKKFQEVREFVRDNKDAGIAVICSACDVTEKQIKQWVREERLVFAADSVVGIDCEYCGAMIKSGRYCDKCKAELARGLAPEKKAENLQPDGPTKHNPKMRFLG
ncbi:MAG: flagellar protein [Lachnospiraceae bacterium]|nr:flagellar protein [Lachnospiraceae bacterium]